MGRRILASFLFVVIMFFVWKWSHFVSHSWPLFLLTMAVMVAAACYYDWRDAKGLFDRSDG
jgi:hypothetical protein